MLHSLHPKLSRSPRDCITCGGSPEWEEGQYGTFKWYVGNSKKVGDYECHCVNQYLLHRYLLNSGIGTRYQRYSWNDAVAVSKDVMSAVVKYGSRSEHHQRTGLGLILHGVSRGTGKTLLSTLLLKSMIADGVDGYFTTFNDMLDAYTSGWRDETQRRWFERRVRHAGFLVVDDIGREHKGRTDIGESMFDAVIRSRVADCKPTIITTNKTLTELEQGYSSNVMSLLAESSLNIEVEGDDYRAQAKVALEAEAELDLVRPVVLA